MAIRTRAVLVLYCFGLIQTASAQTIGHVPTIKLTCAKTIVLPGETSHCRASADGTPVPADTFRWTLNRISASSGAGAKIGTDGVFHAPESAEGTYSVRITATYVKNDAERGSLLITVATPKETKTIEILSSQPSVIELADGSRVEIPTKLLPLRTNVRVQLLDVPIQPTNVLFKGMGPSIRITFTYPEGKPNSGVDVGSIDSRESELQFFFNARNYTSANVARAIAVLDVNNSAGDPEEGQDNYFPMDRNPGSSNGAISAFAYSSTLGNFSDTLQAGLAVTVPHDMDCVGAACLSSSSRVLPGTKPSNAIDVRSKTPQLYRTALSFPSGARDSGRLCINNACLERWDEAQRRFVDVHSSECPAKGRTLVLVHGMNSSAESAFGPEGSGEPPNGWAEFVALGHRFDSVLGVNYRWWNHLNTSADSMARLLNRVLDSSSGCPAIQSFDVEAHSEGTIVSLLSTADLTNDLKSKLQKVVLVAGPIKGTPIGETSMAWLTFLLNTSPTAPGTVWMPAAIDQSLPFIRELGPEGTSASAVGAAQSAGISNIPHSTIIAVGGKRDHSRQRWCNWIEDKALLGNIPNDCVVPMSSALPVGSLLTNLVCLSSSGNSSCTEPFDRDHQDLVDDWNVMQRIWNELNK